MNSPVDKTELMEATPMPLDAAIASAPRWATEAGAPAAKSRTKFRWHSAPASPANLRALVAAKRPKNPLLTRCTYGIVWAASAAANSQGTALALAVQPLDTWRELWVFRQGPQGWSVDVLPPAADHPGLGYIEFAGWVPGGKQLLAAREAKTEGRHKQSFEIRRMACMVLRVMQQEAPAFFSDFEIYMAPDRAEAARIAFHKV
jgi:hypothetical protein